MWRPYLRPLVSLFALIPFLQAFADAPPQLGIAKSGPQVVIGWDDTNNWLQSSHTLGSYSWVNVGTAPTVSGSSNWATFTPSEPALFFRLVRSPLIPPPTRVALKVQRDGTFLMTWDDVPGAMSYNIYQANVTGVGKGNYTMLPGGTVTTGVTNDYVFLTGLTPGQRYYFVVTAYAPPGESADSIEVSGIYGPHGGVSGSVYTQLLFNGTNTVLMPVPGVTLTLTNQSDPTIGDAAQSDIYGHYEIPDQPSGTYQLCWQAPGFVSDCSTQSIVISNASVVADLVWITAATNATNGLIYGQVSFQNGASIYRKNAFYQNNVNPVLTLTDPDLGLLQSTTPNYLGQYIMTGLPVTNHLLLKGQLENSGVYIDVDTRVVGQVDVVFPNSPPRIQALFGTFNGQTAYRVPPGTTLPVTAYASDPDGDPLTFQWYTSSGPAPLGSTSNVFWTLPNDPDGFHYLFLRVSDGKGGYDDARLQLTTSTNFMFSGYVTGSDLESTNGDILGYLTNATVQLNGTATNTDANGFFAFSTPPANQYVLAISAPGYAPLAKVLYDETTERTYSLLKISNPGCDNDATDNIDVTNAAGAILHIPSGALVDSDGIPYDAGNVSVAIDSIDPCDAAGYFAGDNLAVDTMGNQGLLDPFALAHVSVQDCLGNNLFLAPGSTARLFLPYGYNCCNAASAPAQVQAYTLTSSTNRWLPVSSTVFTNTGDGFQADIPVFGLMCPAAVEANGALLVTADRTLHVPFTVAFFKTNGTDLIKYEDILYTTPQGAASTNGTVAGQVVTNLPVGPVVMKVIDLLQSPGAFYRQGVFVPPASKTIVQIITNIVVSQAKTNVVVAGLGTGAGRVAQLEDYTPDAVQQLVFLNQKEPKENANVDTNSPDSVFNQYYALVDPNNEKDTFAKWQIANGWSTNGAGVGNFLGSNAGANDDAFGVYFNANDLGAGRRTGMKINGTNVAYYVATYASLADAVNEHNLKYIVCMEYSPLPPTTENPKPDPVPYVKFYAYGKNGTRTGIVPDEDRHHSTYVPYVCMVCHGGGGYSPEATLAATRESKEEEARKGDVGGQFIGFDTANYTFSLVNGFTRADLFAKDVFKKMNNGLLKSYDTMPQDLLPTLVTNLAAQGYTTAPPAGWGNTAQDIDLHNKVYAVSCRSCHATQSSTYWSTAAKFGAANTAFSYPMPQPQRTFSIFWGSATAHQIDTNIFSQPAQF